MFTKKAKKDFPPDTFLPTPLRILAILQLCLAFTAICLYAGHPFMGALFTQKSHTLLFENVMGTLAHPSSEEHQLFNRQHFEKLPEHERQHIISSYRQVQSMENQSFLEKCKDSILLLFLKTPAFTKGWILFSVVLSILLLRKREGAAQATWVLPILCIAFIFDARHTGTKSLQLENQLFPSEERLMHEYVKEPLSSSILEQHKQLKRGWELYLIQEWAKELISQNPSLRKKQIMKGEFAFNLARLNMRMQNPQPFHFSFIESFNYLYIFYFCWNLYFAWFMNRKKWRYQLV